MIPRILCSPGKLLIQARTGAFVLVLALTACTQEPPTETEPTVPGPSLAAAAQCVAPCVEVTVKFQGKAPEQPVHVSLVNVDEGAHKDSPKLTTDHVATFEGDVLLRDPDDPDGRYCAWVSPITDHTTANGGNTGIVPNALEPGVSVNFAGSITDPTSKQGEAVLTQESLISCFEEGGAFQVGTGDAIGISLTMNNANTLKVKCDDLDGAATNCQAWAVADLSSTSLPFYVQSADGVRPGVLLSAASGNTADIFGLPQGDEVHLEVTGQTDGGLGLFLTSSLDDIETGGTSKKGTTEDVTASLDPLLCRDNTTPAELLGDASKPGVDFDTVHYGYYGQVPLNEATFTANPNALAVFYDFEGFGKVTMKGRLRLAGDDSGSETKSFQLTYSFPERCSMGQPQFLSSSGPGLDLPGFTSLVECREDSKDSTRPQRATWSLVIPSDRRLEFSFESSGLDVYPNPEKSANVSARVLIERTVGICPLTSSTLESSSNDPKFDIIG